MATTNRKPARTADVNHRSAARAPMAADDPLVTAPVVTAPVVVDAPVVDAPSETAIVIAAPARMATDARPGAGRTTIVAPDAQRVIGHPPAACKNGNRPNRM